MKKWTRIILLALVVAVAVAGMTYAAQPPAKPGRAERAMKARAELIRRLEITEAQIQQMRDIVASGKPRAEELQKQTRISRMRLGLAFEEKAGNDRLVALIRECEEAGKRLAEFRGEQTRKIFGVLTVEQQAKVILMQRQDWLKLVLISRPK